MRLEHYGHSAATGLRVRDWKPRFAATALAAALGFALLAPSCVRAAFTRPFLRQITRTEAESGLSCSAESPRSSLCLSPRGVTVDTSENLWVGNGLEALSEFNSLGAFVPPTVRLEGNLSSPPKGNYTFPDNIAIDDATGHFYVTGNNRRNTSERLIEVFDKTGALVEQWKEEFGGVSHIAIDNSPNPLDPSRESVYVAHEQEDPRSPLGDASPKGIGRFDASGIRVEFNDAQKCEEEKCGYIKGNEIVGTPSRSFEHETPQAIAVDSQGIIYVAGGEERSEVDEYLPSGVFVRAIAGNETPGLGGNHERNGFGGKLQAVAVDPVSGHVLVSVSSNEQDEGAVDEFESSGRFLNQVTKTEIEVSPGIRQRSHLGSVFDMTADAQGDVYVVDNSSEQAVDVYGAGHFFPSLRVAEASGRHPESAALNGFVDPEGLKLTDCHFEYVTEAAFEHNVETHKGDGFADVSSGGEKACTPAAGEIAADTNYHAVSAEVGGLVSGTTYRYRLVATTSASELGGTAGSEPVAFTAPHPPAVDAASATNISSAFADLRARINPLGADTTYRFEYSSDGVAWAKAPVPDADIGSGGPTGSADASVVQQIGPLAPGTTYRFRVVAANSIGVAVGPESTFTTLPRAAPGLPDGRAYELVTPPNKGSSPDMFLNVVGGNSNTGYASESGTGFLLTTTLSTFGSFSASEHNAYLFSRTSSGWQTTSLASPSLGVQNLVGTVFSPSDFSRVGISDFVGSESSSAGSEVTTFVGPPGGPYTKLHADSPVHGSKEEDEAAGETEIVGASHDVDQVVVESKDHNIAPGGETQIRGTEALYEWSEDEFKLVNVNSKGVLLNLCGAVLGQSHVPGNRHNAVSSDGSKIVFTSPDPYGGCWNGGVVNAPQLYMRSGQGTTELSRPERGVSDPTGRHLVKYVGASEDGSRVFFVTQTELTKDDAGIHDRELYEYDTETAKLTRISAGESGKAAAGVSTVPAIAASGTAVYFTASGRLTSGAFPSASGEQVYLYRYDTATGGTVYVATVDERDYPSGTLSGWGAEKEIALGPGHDWYTTPDGRYLLFATTNEIPSVGYSTVAVGPNDCPALGGIAPNGHCAEVYRYDAQTGDVICISCDPSGAAPVSNASFAADAGSSVDPAAGPVRAVSDDGSYVFFDTGDALVPQDGNGTLDVYEWHNGVVSLVSSGVDAAPSFFLGASSDGHDVFLGTHARLVPQDTDYAGDIYDARVCEAEKDDPCIKPPTGETAQCEGDACQNPPPSPIDATPGSLTFSGAGNATQRVRAQAAPRRRAKPTSTRRLAKALASCRKRHNKTQRKKCEARARKRYAKKTARTGGAPRVRTSSGTAR
jgi:hypothetical protein